MELVIRRGKSVERFPQPSLANLSLVLQRDPVGSEGCWLVWIVCRVGGEWFGVGERWWLGVVLVPAGRSPGGAAVGVVGD